MKRLAGAAIWGVITLSAVSTYAGDLAFPESEQEICQALSFREATIVHEGQEYVSTKEGEVFMVVEGKRYRMKGIGGLVHTSLVPKTGALVTFNYNSAEIRPESYQLLGQYGKALTNELAGARLIVEGHTDDYGTEEYNYELSELRAKAVRKYLRENFNIDPNHLLIRGAGESRPIAGNDTENSRSLNRRVEFIRITTE
ncbi:MAG: OmpA family protein [Desulfobulbaceae bacterium]|nr:OmpA family protein [Desulfobulbaceae bacterium]